MCNNHWIGPRPIEQQYYGKTFVSNLQWHADNFYCYDSRWRREQDKRIDLSHKISQWQRNISHFSLPNEKKKRINMAASISALLSISLSWWLDMLFAGSGSPVMLHSSHNNIDPSNIFFPLLVDKWRISYCQVDANDKNGQILHFYSLSLRNSTSIIRK